MPLNNSGPISMGGSTTGESINLELGKSATAQISLNDSDARSLAGKPSGQISLSDFYGKSRFAYLGAWKFIETTSAPTSIDILSGDSFGFSFPSIVQNDLLIILVSTASRLGNNITHTVTTSGFVQVSDLYASTGTGTARAVNGTTYYKLMGSTPDTTINLSFASTGGTEVVWLVSVLAFRGVSTSSPLDVTSTTATQTGNMNLNGPSITTVTNNAMCVTVGTFSVSSFSYSFSPPSANIEATWFGGGISNTAGLSTRTVHQLATAGAFDIGPFTPGTDSNSSWIATTLAVRPA